VVTARPLGGALSGALPDGNPFWPYDLSVPIGEPSPRRYLSWEQHARMDPSVPTAARGATLPDPGDRQMQATVTAGLAPEQLATLLTLLDEAEVSLGSFTEEELAAVDPPDEDALVPLTILELTSDEGQQRDRLLAAALRSLAARGLVVGGDEPGGLVATGALSTVLSLRGTPNFVLVAEHLAEDDPARLVVYGLRVTTDDGETALVMEEAVAALGHHEFVLRSVEGQAGALAGWLGAVAPSDGPPPVGALDAALQEPRSMTRLYVLRREDDGAGEEGEFSQLELTVVDGGPLGRWMVLFQEGEDGTEGFLAVPVEALDLEAFFAALLRLDLTPFNEALAAS
jgi:hypothetical protein